MVPFLGFRTLALFEMLHQSLFVLAWLAQTIEEHGTFSFAYLGTNLYYALLDIPQLRPEWPFVIMDGWGLSMLISTPALILILWAMWRERSIQAAALAILGSPSIAAVLQHRLLAGRLPLCA